MSELDIIRLIQSIHNESLDFIFQVITMLGESATILMIILSIYWSFNKKVGEYVAYSFLTSALLNNIIKNIIRAPRPINEEGIRSLRIHTATGYSFPSGHSQGAASTYWAFAVSNRRKILKIISVIVILLVGFSRLYLGVHYPKDVIFGIIFGMITAATTHYLFQRFENKQLLYLATLLVFSVGILNPSPDFTKSLGSFMGFIMGRKFEMKYVNYDTDIAVSHRVIRIVGGGMLLLVIKVILGEFLHSQPLEIWISHVVITFIGFGLIPLSFVISHKTA